IAVRAVPVVESAVAIGILDAILGKDKYYLIGGKLSHSYSVDIHSAFGLDYRLKELDNEHIAGFLKENFVGLNVTIPHKTAVMAYLDEVDERAKNVGAVNTVLKKDGLLIGYNTDVFGMEYAFKRMGEDVKGKDVLILGSGGASKSAQEFCRIKNAKSVTVVSRSGRVNYENCYDLQGTQIIINATPVGTYPNEDETPIDVTRFNSLGFVFDANYNPLKTQLVLNAEKCGIKSVGGLAMLVAQGLKAEEGWGVGKVDESLCELTIDKIVNGKRNTVLIGMPSSGKTTLGRELAKRTGRPFVDTDEEIGKTYGEKPSEIIEKYGEEVFRRRESEIIKRVTLMRGAVIALGGGGVLREENRDAIKRNGKIIYIERDLSHLTDNDRPLSKNGAISRLFEQREPIYLNCCDEKIQNNDDIESAVKRLVEL
ncbi:MAG: shikimate kinase, partial [Clostridia bacterium]|nr:shikimate kinase [Clostridia bacterium]